MKYILITITVVLIISSCSGGGSEGYQPIQYNAPVSAVTIKGDSMAAGIDSLGDLTQYWLQWNTSVENNGIGGATIEYLLLNPDHRQLNTVEFWAGYNDLKDSTKTIPSILALYSHVYELTYLHESNLHWIPYNTTMDNSRVDAFNNGVKVLCPNFVDTSDLITIDGVHPDPSSYMTAGQRIGVLL